MVIARFLLRIEPYGKNSKVTRPIGCYSQIVDGFLTARWCPNINDIFIEIALSLDDSTRIRYELTSVVNQIS